MSHSRAENLINSGKVESVVEELLLNPQTMRRLPTLADRPVSEILDSAKLLTRILDGMQWRGHPRLVLLDEDVLVERAENLHGLFNSNRWRSVPALLLAPSERIRDFTDQLTDILVRNFG